MSQTQQIPAIPQVRKINLNQSGLEMFMGRTEAPIMRAVWQGKTRITTIHRYVCREYTELSKSSISTTVQRLVDKGFLVKLPIVNSAHNEHEYLPTCDSEQQFILTAVHQTLTQLYATYPRIFDIVTEMLALKYLE